MHRVSHRQELVTGTARTRGSIRSNRPRGTVVWLGPLRRSRCRHSGTTNLRGPPTTRGTALRSHTATDTRRAAETVRRRKRRVPDRIRWRLLRLRACSPRGHQKLLAGVLHHRAVHLRRLLRYPETAWDAAAFHRSSLIQQPLPMRRGKLPARPLLKRTRRIRATIKVRIRRPSSHQPLQHLPTGILHLNWMRTALKRRRRSNPPLPGC